MARHRIQLPTGVRLRWRAGDAPEGGMPAVSAGSSPAVTSTAAGFGGSREGYDQGWRDAEKSLREQMVQQRNELVQLKQGALKALQDAVGEVTRQSESLLVDLAVEVARKLVHGLPIDSAMIAAAVRNSLEEVDPTSTVTVQLHPEDHHLFEALGEAERSELVGGRSVKCVASAHVTRGGCVVQTSFGILDTQRETILRTVKEALA